MTKRTKRIIDHLVEYTWATKDEWMEPIKVEDDDRKWFYTAKKMHKGIMHARIVGFDSFIQSRKKLVPLDKITFLKV